MRHFRFVWLGLMLLASLNGCAAPPRALDDAAQREMLALLMPSRVEIVEPFTRVKSFDDNATPDGIELLIQAVNALDNPGLMIAGRVRVELYEYVPASADQKGRRLEHWDIELTTAHEQRTYWNALTQMYEFQLGIDPAKIPPADKYVLAVTYTSPLGDHLTDECIISYKTATLERVDGDVRGLLFTTHEPEQRRSSHCMPRTARSAWSAIDRAGMSG